MSELIKVSPKICQKCKYHMGFGAQPGREQRVVSNVCCNYADYDAMEAYKIRAKELTGLTLEDE